MACTSKTSSSSCALGRFVSLLGLVAVGIIARLAFSLVLMDSVVSVTGREPFSIATVDSSGSHWRERLYWERAAAAVAASSPSSSAASSSSSSPPPNSFLPFYLEQVPYWPVKLFMTIGDAVGEAMMRKGDGDGVKTKFNVLVADSVISSTAGSSSSNMNRDEGGSSSHSSSSHSFFAPSSPIIALLYNKTYPSLRVRAVLSMVRLAATDYVLPLAEDALDGVTSGDVASIAQKWQQTVAKMKGASLLPPPSHIAFNSFASDAKRLGRDVAFVGRYIVEECVVAGTQQMIASLSSSSSSLASSRSNTDDGFGTASSSSSFWSTLHARMRERLGVFEVTMIVIDAILVTLLIKGISISGDSTSTSVGGTADVTTADDGARITSPTTGKLLGWFKTVATPSADSIFFHALNPLSIFCCATLSLRVVEHCAILLLCWLLLKGEGARFPSNNKKKRASLIGRIVGFFSNVIAFSVSLWLVILLIKMSPAMVVLLLPLGFRFICADGQTSFLRYLAMSIAVLAASGYVAYKASIGLAELPTTTPPDAGHQSYLWQVLLPEIAELAQATFVMGPVVAVVIIGLQMCDPAFAAMGYRQEDMPSDDADDEEEKAEGNAKNDGKEKKKDSNTKKKKAGDGDDEKAQHADRDTIATTTPVVVPISRIYSPLRALLVASILFSAIVRRYYSLSDTLFAVVVVPLVVSPHIMKPLLAQAFLVVPMLMLFVSIPLQHATYTSWVVKQLANANWLYFANLTHHGGLSFFCGQFIYCMLRPCYDLDAKERGVENAVRKARKALRTQREEAKGEKEREAAASP